MSKKNVWAIHVPDDPVPASEMGTPDGPGTPSHVGRGWRVTRRLIRVGIALGVIVAIGVEVPRMVPRVIAKMAASLVAGGPSNCSALPAYATVERGSEVARFAINPKWAALCAGQSVSGVDVTAGTRLAYVAPDGSATLAVLSAPAIASGAGVLQLGAYSPNGCSGGRYSVCFASDGLHSAFSASDCPAIPFMASWSAHSRVLSVLSPPDTPGLCPTQEITSPTLGTNTVLYAQPGASTGRVLVVLARPTAGAGSGLVNTAAIPYPTCSPCAAAPGYSDTYVARS